ncbi:hypothetical protein D3C81_1932040 [compost metagenome]
MAEIPAGDRRSRPHGEGFGQFHAGMAVNVQQLPDLRFFGMFWASRIAGSRADALIILTDQLFVTQIFIGGKAPMQFAHLLVEIFGKGLCQTIG